ncbi:MAG: molecular chaperone DnaJ, partial [Candidatus Omnitrophica bacterium]|nr:molecular chaperone DnaJ [Candidatus Omnitrophota bacterium]
TIFKDLGGFGSGESIFEEIFSDLGFDLFGTQRTKRGRKRRGEDINYEIEISLEDSAKGIEKTVEFQRLEACFQCKGTGLQPGTTKTTCSTCRGRGVVSSGLGFITLSQTCPNCGGEGVIGAKCTKCRGQGRELVNKVIKVNIPAGVDNGSVLRLRGEGNFGVDDYGDLYLHINVRKHPLFERIGNDIKYKIKLSVVKATLGGEIDVPTLNGKVKMSIPPGTQPSTIFRLRGKGIVDFRTKRVGDELVEVDIEIPKKLTPKEKNLLIEFGKLRGEL